MGEHPHKARGIVPLLIQTLILGTLAFLPSCGGIQTKPPATPAASLTPDGKIRVTADWDDLWAAAMGGASAYGWIVVSEQERTPTSVKFEMLSVRDRTGWLLAERADPALEFEDHPVPVTLSAQLGLFGDQELESALLMATAHRLEDLIGESFSELPIREFVPEQPEADPVENHSSSTGSD